MPGSDPMRAFETPAGPIETPPGPEEGDEEEEAPYLSLPPDFTWFDGQIAGHHPSVVKNGQRQIGLLKRHGSRYVHKPSQEGDRGARELALYSILRRFYSETSNENGDGESTGLNNGQTLGEDELFPPGEEAFWMRLLETEKLSQDEQAVLRTLATLSPRYHGVETLRIGDKDYTSLVLEDITAGYSMPATLDVKMGLVTADPAASGKKRASEAKKYKPQATLGFRLCGYQMHTAAGVVIKDKAWGKAFDESDVHLGLAEFFSGRAPDASRVVADALRLTRSVREWQERQRLVHLYASSLLFVYDLDPEREPRVDVKMIDFSHAFPAHNAPDSNYIPGADNLLAALGRIR